MAPFVPAAGTIQVDLRFRLDDQWLSNTFYASKIVGTPTSAEMATLGSLVVGWYTNDYRNQLPTAVTLNEIYLRDISQQSGPILSVTSTLPLAGALTGQVLPNNVTFTVSLRTGLAGRSYRGRIYVTGIRFADVASSEPNSLVAARANGIVASWNALRNALLVNLQPYQMCVVSRYTNLAPRTTAVVTPVTNVLAVDRVLDSQRRRLPKRGV